MAGKGRFWQDFVTCRGPWYRLSAGTEQRRKFTLEGNKLTIVTIPQPMGTGHRAKAMVTCKVVWEREA